MSFSRFFSSAMLFLFAGLASAQNTPFAGPLTQTLSFYPQALANLQKGAGVDMLALSNGSVLVLLANGNQLTYPIPDCAAMFITGSLDVNSDGNNDVVVQCPQMLIVLLGNGDGTLQAPVEYGTAEAMARGQFLFEDLNRDGTLDLAYVVGAGPNAGDVAVAPSVSYPAGKELILPVEGNPANNVALAVGDVNGDGYPDIVVLSSEVSYFLNLKGQGFGPAQHVPDTFGYGNANVAVADLNHDGYADIVTSFGNEVQVINGNAGGVLMTSRSFALDDAANAYFTLADLNGDGNLDVVAFYNFGADVLLGDGKGGFSEPGFYSFPSPPVVVDVDGDGKPDLMAVNTSATGNLATIQLNRGDGTFTQPPGSAHGISTNSPAVIADFNGDGLLDSAALVAQPRSSQLMLTRELSNGDGSFRYEPGPLLPGGSLFEFNSALFTADVNKDGRPDVVAIELAGSGSAEQVVACLNTGGSGFACGPLQSLFQTSSHAFIAGATVADVDGDGKPDVLLSVYDTSSLVDTLYLAKGNGAGSFAPAVALGASLTDASSAQQLFVADMNGDGIPDVVMGGAGGTSAVFTRSAGGTYTSKSISGIVLGVADLNHDGINDLITASPGSNSTFTFYFGGPSNTSSTLLTQFQADFGTLPAVAVGDVNGDGFPDLVMEGPGTSETEIAVATNDGAGNFTLTADTIRTPFIGNTTTLALGKLNRLAKSSGQSARLDLLVGQRSFVSYLNQGNAQPARLALSSVALTASVNPVNSGQTTSLTATVIAATGSGSPSGTVTFWNDGDLLATVNVANGKAVLSAPTSGIPQGLYGVSAVYNGSSAFASSVSNTLLVAVKASAMPTQTFLLTNPYQVAEGSPEILTASVIPGVGPGTPTGNVSFSASPYGSSQTIPLATVALNNGRAVLSATVPAGFPAGTYQVVARYLGGDGFAPSDSRDDPDIGYVYPQYKTTTTITSIPTDVTPNSYIQVSVTVKNDDTAVYPTGYITVFVGTVSIGNLSLTTNPAPGTTVYSGTLDLYAVQPGEQQVTATYDGNDTMARSTSAPVQVNVQ